MSINKKILIFEAYPIFSGSQKVSYSVAQLLTQQGHNTTLLLADDSTGVHKEQFKGIVNRIIEIRANKTLTQYGNNKKWLRFGKLLYTFVFGLLPFYFRLFLFFRKERFDAYYYCDPRGALMILPAAVWTHGKKIMHMHGKNILPMSLTKLILSLSDQVICVSNGVLSSLPKSPKKKLIYNGVCLSKLGDKSTKSFFESQSINVPVDAVKLLFVGQLKPAKGVHHLIHSMSELQLKLPRLKVPYLFILGQPHSKEEAHYKEILVNESRRGGFEHLIHWMGHQKNVADWMSNCSFFVFPSVDQEKNSFPGFSSITESTEGLPTVLIEASLSNLFSISSSVTGVEEIITENKNGIIYDHSKQDSLTYALQRCILEKKRFESFPNKESFSQKRFEIEILRVFET